jgi:predicted dithiol-disulfide oxidoreductase (DUF899 family)
MTITETITTSHPIATKENWLQARKDLLSKEKELTRQRDELSRMRRELPWIEVTEDYVFEGPNGPETLSQLFAGRGQLVIYHFMFGPEWAEGCPSCSMLADSFDGMLPHLQQRDVTFLVVSRAPIERINTFKKRMGWSFKWVSSHGTSFNYDYQVSFTPEQKSKGEIYYNYGPSQFPADEAPGASVFYKDETGRIFHTYSTYGRGLDPQLAPYGWLDLTPKGRNEEGLVFPMAWVRHHDKYESAPAMKSATESCCHPEEHRT